MVGKTDPWSTTSRLHEDMTLDPAAAYTHHFTGMSGMCHGYNLTFSGRTGLLIPGIYLVSVLHI